MLKFLKCKNPNISHIKLAFGKLLQDWVYYKCECGYEFEGFIEIYNDVIPDQLPCFENVNPDDDTKEFPTIK